MWARAAGVYALHRGGARFSVLYPCQHKASYDVACCQHEGQQCAGLLKLQSMPSGLGSAHSSPRLCKPIHGGKQTSQHVLHALSVHGVYDSGWLHLAGGRLPLANPSGKLLLLSRSSPSLPGGCHAGLHTLIKAVLAASISSQLAQSPIMPALSQATTPGLQLLPPSCLRTWRHPAAHFGNLCLQVSRLAASLATTLLPQHHLLPCPACLQTSCIAPAADPQLQLEQG